MMIEITNEPFQTLSVRKINEGIAIVESKLIDRKWKPRTFILNKREALKLNQAISDIILGREDGS